MIEVYKEQVIEVEYFTYQFEIAVYIPLPRTYFVSNVS